VADIHYTPAFRHTDWFNNVDRVDAEGPNGFNVRFHAIESDLQALSTVVTQIDTELDRLGTPPAPVEKKLRVPPALLPIRGFRAWESEDSGAASTLGNGPTGNSAFGLVHLDDLPDGATPRSLRAVGVGVGAEISVIFESHTRTDPHDSGGVARFDRPLSGAFDVTVPVDFPRPIDLSTQRFTINVAVRNNTSTDRTFITFLEITYI
jgi:hypothetical protein